MRLADFIVSDMEAILTEWRLPVPCCQPPRT
jgi:hypothetical protein